MFVWCTLLYTERFHRSSPSSSSTLMSTRAIKLKKWNEKFVYEASEVQQTRRLHLEQAPYVVRRNFVLSMSAENAGRFHRSSTSDSGALMSIWHSCAVS